MDLKTVNMPICESEKLGVSVLGCRFTEKAEHVPIKKRRFVYRSPSPPPRGPSRHSEETEMVSKTKPRVIDCTASANDLGLIVDRGCDVDKANLEEVKAQVDDNEDFSGISILAAAACSKGFGREDGHAEDASGVEESFVCEGPSECSTNKESCLLSIEVSKDDLCSAEISTEGTGSFISASPVENLVACIKTVHSSANGLSHGNKVKDSSVQDQTVGSEDLLTIKDKETVRKQGLPSRDGRLHWDLNRVDSWKHLFDYRGLDSNANDAGAFDEDNGKMGNPEGSDLLPDLGDSKSAARKGLLPGDSREMVLEKKQSKVEVCKSEKSIFSQENMLSSELHHDAKGQFEEGKQPLHCQERIITDAVSVLVPADDAKRLSASLNVDQSHRSVSVGHTLGNDDSSLHGFVSLHLCAANNEDISVSSDSRVEEQEVSPLVTFYGNSTGGIDDALDKAVADAKEISGSLDQTSKLTDIVALETGQPLKTGHLDNVNENHSSSDPLGDEMPASAALVEVQPALVLELKVQDEEGSVHVSAETDTSVLINREEAATKCTEKSEELLQGSLVRSSHGHVKSSKLEVDYDSQYEDGEVRESIIHAWEEYDGEDMEVDYGSDDATNLTCDAVKTMKHIQETNFQPCLSGPSGSGKERSVKGKHELESGNQAGPVKVTGDNLVDRGKDSERPSLSADSTIKLSGRRDHRKFSDSMTGEGDGSSRKNLTDGYMDVMATEGAKMRMVGSRECRRESHIKGQALQGGYIRDKAYMQRSSDADTSNPGNVESFGKVRYRAHARAEEDDHWVNSVDSHRGRKCYRSRNYYGPTSFHHPSPENAASLGIHRRLRRSGSPVDRDDAFRLRMGFRPSREMSLTRGRGRSLTYGPWLDGRGPRDRYHGPVPDDCYGPSSNHSHPSSKRERSFSPVDRRGEDPARKSHSKSPPRSRTRSPNLGNPSSGSRSKSPNFRAQDRMHRGRSPHQRSAFVADHMVGIRKMHRNHGNPPCHNSRRAGDWKDGMVRFREQTRFGPRDERFDFDSPRNYRPMHTGGFLEIEGVGRGRQRCEGDDDTREKHGHRFGLVPPANRFDKDGPTKRFHYNVDEDFVKTRNSRNGDAVEFNVRGGLRQFGRGSDGPRRFRDERDPFIHQSDEKYNCKSKILWRAGKW